MIVLETERLTLRRLTADDAPFILRLLNEPSFLRFIGDKGVRSIEDAREYIINGPIDSHERHGYGLDLVESKETGSPIGICGLVNRETLDDVDIGFAFLPECWRQGYAFESASATMDRARDELGLPRLVAITSIDNDASAGLLEKMGMTFERTISLSEDAPEVKLFAIDF